jgi:Domain of unknown function (DUF4158)
LASCTVPTSFLESVLRCFYRKFSAFASFQERFLGDKFRLCQKTELRSFMIATTVDSSWRMIMKRVWTADELVEYWTLAPSELELLANKTGPTRLGFALLLKFFQFEGRFPQHRNEIPPTIIAHMAKQTNVPADHVLQYNWRSRAIKYHRAQIRDVLGFREPTLQDAQELVEWLVTAVVPHDHRLDSLQAAVYGRCRELRVEPPTLGRVMRLIRSALRTYETQFFAATLAQLSPAVQAQLDALLVEPVPMDNPDDDTEPTSTLQESAARSGPHWCGKSALGDRQTPASPPDHPAAHTLSAPAPTNLAGVSSTGCSGESECLAGASRSRPLYSPGGPVLSAQSGNYR